MPEAVVPETFRLERATLLSTYILAAVLLVAGILLAYFIRGDKNSLVPWWAGGGAVTAVLALLWRLGLIFFPPLAEVRDGGVKLKVFKYLGMAVDEFTVPMDKIASLSKIEGMLFSNVIIENSGGDRDLQLVGLWRGDARRLMALVEDLRQKHPVQAPEPPSRPPTA